MIEFVPIDPERTLHEMIQDFEKQTGEVLYPGDERRILMQVFLQAIVALQGNDNLVGNNNLLEYAQGAALDAIGMMSNTPRLQQAYASTILQFTLAQPTGVVIPKGTRVRSDSQVLFATISDVSVPAGNTKVDVDARAQSAGAITVPIGSVTAFVDLLPNIASVVNTTVSSGGTDQEDDESYRNRIQRSWSRTTTAGSEQGYLYWAKSASTDIADVFAAADDNATVSVTILPYSTAIAGNSLLQQVREALCADTVRPLTDHVVVVPAQPVDYSIDLTYYITDRINEEKIKKEIVAAIQTFKKTQLQKLGLSLNPDSLRKRMLDAGAYRVDIRSPSYQVLTRQQVAHLTTESIIYGGLL